MCKLRVKWASLVQWSVMWFCRKLGEREREKKSRKKKCRCEYTYLCNEAEGKTCCYNYHNHKPRPFCVSSNNQLAETRTVFFRRDKLEKMTTWRFATVTIPIKSEHTPYCSQKEGGKSLIQEVEYLHPCKRGLYYSQKSFTCNDCRMKSYYTLTLI